MHRSDPNGSTLQPTMKMATVKALSMQFFTWYGQVM